MYPQLLIRGNLPYEPIRVGGSVDAAIAPVFAQVLTNDVRALSGGTSRIELDLDELELDDGSAVVEAVNALKELLQEADLVVRHAPQMLAHTLYKTGMLRGGRLILESPRREEAHS